jgi:hypothetical protein
MYIGYFGIIAQSTYSLHSVVARVEPETHDVSDELLREHRKLRLEAARKPREMGLRVSLESAGVSDPYDVPVRVIGGYLSARAEK